MQDSLQITALLHIWADSLDDTQRRSRPASQRGAEIRHNPNLTPEMIL